MDLTEQLTWPDAQLLEWVGDVISQPKEAPADSFVLHAPLELMARAALLERLEGDARNPARRRIAELARAYEGAGASVAPPAPVAHASAADGTAALVKAIDAGDLGETDRNAAWLFERTTPDELRSLLGPALAPSLAAAAHATIGLWLLGRSPSIPASVLRGTARELARHPDWQVTWAGLAAGDEPLLDALLAAPRLGLPGNNTIYPMVAQGAHASAGLLARVAPDAVAGLAAVGRVAAWSMLQDTPDQAPYGWSHCLTMPQAVLSVGLPPAEAVAVAGTQLIGMRAALGTRDLDPTSFVPPAAPGLATELAAIASAHHDAHLVKYTLACLDAANADPEAADLYLAAAARLAGWWAEHDAAA